MDRYEAQEVKEIYKEEEMNTSGLKAQINEVVEARGKAREASCQRVAEYNKWLEANQSLFDNEKSTKCDQDLAEIKLRELTLQAYAETGNKAPEVGVGIREVTKLDYDSKEAFNWAMEHKMAVKLDVSAFEKIVKVASETRPAFVTVSQEPQATIATDLQEL